MPKGNQKAVLVAERRRKKNKSARKSIKTFVASTEKAITAGQTESARASLDQAISALDKAARRGTIHRNSASRRKSRLMKQFNALST